MTVRHPVLWFGGDAVVLQCVAVCCSVLQGGDAVRRDICVYIYMCICDIYTYTHIMQICAYVYIYYTSVKTLHGCSELCCSVLQSVAVCCSELRTLRISTQRNTLQHTATHCNTLQHTATHCNTLQHTAPHGNTVQHSHVQQRQCTSLLN